MSLVHLFIVKYKLFVLISDVYLIINIKPFEE